MVICLEQVANYMQMVQLMPLPPSSVASLKSRMALHCVSKKRLNFETVLLEIIRIDFDVIWQKCSKYSRIEFVLSLIHI